ncbi:MAG: YciI family protein [Sandaracinaceae bacterium]
MQYLLLIYESEDVRRSLGEAERGALFQEYVDVTEAFKQEGAFVAGDALQPVGTATSVRIRDGETMFTDGPFAETKEQLGGYYLVEARDLDHALSLAKRIPASRTGTVEVRPILEY